MLSALFLIVLVLPLILLWAYVIYLTYRITYTLRYTYNLRGSLSIHPTTSDSSAEYRPAPVARRSLATGSNTTRPRTRRGHRRNRNRRAPIPSFDWGVDEDALATWTDPRTEEERATDWALGDNTAQVPTEPSPPYEENPSHEETVLIAAQPDSFDPHQTQDNIVPDVTPLELQAIADNSSSLPTASSSPSIETPQENSTPIQLPPIRTTSPICPAHCTCVICLRQQVLFGTIAREEYLQLTRNQPFAEESDSSSESD